MTSSLYLFINTKSISIVLYMRDSVLKMNAYIFQGKKENNNKNSKNAQHLHRIEKLKQEMMVGSLRTRFSVRVGCRCP